ncbi:hypothetical protein DVQ09_19880 [Yersinia enterocolitica]|nr:hypothetical protein [Yersinia enterocolitica]EKN6132046.1 hypothetical protein [Yersinia enterocolitica]EKN6144993.1 hypothetical protein [Yersinia enterocolitica]
MGFYWKNETDEQQKSRQKKGNAMLPFELNDKAVDNLVSEGVTAPRGTPVAYATTTPTARFPFI